MAIFIAAGMGFLLGATYMWCFGRYRRYWDALDRWAINGGYPETMRRDVLNAMSRIENGEEV